MLRPERTLENPFSNYVLKSLNYRLNSSKVKGPNALTRRLQQHSLAKGWTKSDVTITNFPTIYTLKKTSESRAAN
ncbi:hypothetical protein DERP_013552 [Dermatophagoides pteronyssinus]|uniref:Uncharacterized protein n=1 Tax=Dermatophagoides pteronyssinus TaxID=6956 RepID=A0ABQ8J5J9_DERPT|nr:hypothetical protein DERP_013552 [Dermatophagoides pteronyssinus]